VLTMDKAATQSFVSGPRHVPSAPHSLHFGVGGLSPLAIASPPRRYRHVTPLLAFTSSLLCSAENRELAE
jgi:hypothetical protein